MLRQNIRKYTFFICLIFYFLSSKGSDSTQLNFPVLIASPFESYNYFGLNYIKSNVNHESFDFNDYQFIIPFGMAVKYKVFEKKNIVIDANGSINTQFLFRNEKSIHLRGIRKTHYNTDFVLRINSIFRLNEFSKIRFSIYHKSTHLGDDYIQLNKLSIPDYWSSDESNYEAMRLDYAFQKQSIIIYLGGEIVVSPETPRKRIELHQGVVFNDLSDYDRVKKIIFGYDLRTLSNNNYNLDQEYFIGYSIAKKSHIRVSYFNGNIPFSRYESSFKTNWIGIGYYINSLNL